MKTNHLLASAAFTAMLVVTLPAHAQILGGGFGAMGSAASAGTNMSASGRAGGRVTGFDRVDRTTKAGAHAAGRDVQDAKVAAAVAGRQSVAAGNAALGTARTAAGTAAATSVTAADQGEARARNVDTAAAVAGGLSSTEVPGTKAEAGSSKPAASQPARATKPDSPSSPRHSSPTRESGSPGPNPKSTSSGNGGETPRSPHRETDADASASASASATH